MFGVLPVGGYVPKDTPLTLNKQQDRSVVMFKVFLLRLVELLLTLFLIQSKISVLTNQSSSLMNSEVVGGRARKACEQEVGAKI